MGLDERIKCSECGSIEYKTIKVAGNLRKTIRVCEQDCSQKGKVLKIFEK